MREHERVVGRERLELVVGARERKADDLRHPCGEERGEARMRVEARPDGRAALGERQQPLRRLIDPSATERDLGRIAGEFLAERERRRVLRVGPADLDHVGEGGGLGGQRRLEPRERGLEASLDVDRGGDVHRRREAVVRGLAAVDVVVGMDGLLRAERGAEALVGAVGDHLVDVHVGLGAGPGLPDDEREMPVETTVLHFARRSDDRVGEPLFEHAEVAVDLGRDALHAGEGVDDLDRHRPVADPEVLEGSLRLRAPIAVGLHLDRAERVALAPCPRDAVVHRPDRHQSAPLAPIRRAPAAATPMRRSSSIPISDDERKARSWARRLRARFTRLFIVPTAQPQIAAASS